jgi:exodeoxyribonuclease VII large subunit
MEPQVIGVKQFIGILNETLGFAFPAVTVEGEVGSFKVNQGKWVFFDLKDDDATLGCFMPVYQLKVPLEDGMKVRVTGVPKLTNWGKFSFTVKSVELAGEGELRRAFELLKERLGAEGLFDDTRKRLLPTYPATVGLISSVQSAAYQDFIKILNARWGGVTVKVADVQVQGAPAPDQIVAAIDYFNQMATPVDVLVLIRGGGSLEDLQAFNTEAVARAVAGSRTPIIVGVGHEVDVSLADFAADVRAATPTDAARLVVPDRAHMTESLSLYEHKLERLVGEKVAVLQQTLDRSMSQMERFVRTPREEVLRMMTSLKAAEINLVQSYKQRLESMRRLLGSFDPQATLERGYAIVKHKDKVVKAADQVSNGDPLVVQLARGSIKTKVTNG